MLNLKTLSALLIMSGQVVDGQKQRLTLAEHHEK